MKKTILLTGGAGYIGSHICSELFKKIKKLEQNGEVSQYHILIVDNLSNSQLNNYHKLREHYSIGQSDIFTFDLRNETDIEWLFRAHQIDLVIHLAGFKSVKKSMEDPLSYYDNNITGTLVLLKMMKKYGVRKLIFSSSATVYGDASCTKNGAITEDFPVQPINAYGQTKAMIEQMLMDMAKGAGAWQFVILRYFNPVGADENGLIGEDSPVDEPENLVPYILKVGTGELEQLTVFGNDYDTPDGTCIRDYLHVSDLADAHLKAMDYLDNSDENKTCAEVFNLGTGKGYSVLEMIQMFNNNGVFIPYTIGERRPGDSQEIYANAQKAHQKMGWSAQRDLKEMCQSGWTFWNQRSKT